MGYCRSHKKIKIEEAQTCFEIWRYILYRVANVRKYGVEDL
jgi:hypothetical protein